MRTLKFKVGDKVKYSTKIDYSYMIPPSSEKIYTVVSANANPDDYHPYQIDFLNGHGTNWFCDESELTLVTESNVKFKQGDTVLCKKSFMDFFTKGRLYKVIDQSNTELKMINNKGNVDEWDLENFELIKKDNSKSIDNYLLVQGLEALKREIDKKIEELKNGK